MKQIVLATGNRGKVVEMARFLEPLGLQVLSLADFPAIGEIVEDGATFEANALIKARAVAGHTGLPALADDSGLEVDALGGAPGVYSARYAPGSDEDRYRKLLLALEGMTERAARFVSVLAAVTSEGREATFWGTVEGQIGLAPRGEGGFGYDPVFVLPDGRTMAELTTDEKNAISHRGRALQACLPALPGLLGL